MRSTQKDEYQGVPKVASDYFFIGRRRPSGRKEGRKEKQKRKKPPRRARRQF